MNGKRMAILWIASVALSSVCAGKAPDGNPRVAPNFELPGKERQVALDDYKGKIVYLDFWASWCSPCQASFPWMNAMQEKYGDKGLVVLAVNLDRKKKDAEAFLEKNPARFIVTFDQEWKTAKEYKVEGMPSAYLIGKDGTVLHTHIGFSKKNSEKYEENIRKALGI